LSLASDIHDEFVRKGYTWNFKVGGQKTPTVDDIDKTLAYMSETLNDQNAVEGATLEFPLSSGRLIMKINEGVKDVYVHYGSIKENDND